MRWCFINVLRRNWGREGGTEETTAPGKDLKERIQKSAVWRQKEWRVKNAWQWQTLTGSLALLGVGPENCNSLGGGEKGPWRVAWDRHKNTADSLILLLRGAETRGGARMKSSEVLKKAAEMQGCCSELQLNAGMIRHCSICYN